MSFSGNFFDPTVSAASSDQDSIGSYLVGAGGDVVTTTTISAIKALDVNVANSIAIVLNGIYDGSTNLLPSNAGMIVSTRASSPSLSTQTQQITGGANAATLVAADVHALDVSSVMYAYDGTTYSRLTQTTISSVHALDVNVANSLRVHLNGIYDGSTNLVPDNAGMIVSTRASSPSLSTQTQQITGGANGSSLTAGNVYALDVAAVMYGYDGTNYSRIGEANNTLNVNDSFTAFSVERHTVTSSAASIVTSALSNRRQVQIYNNGNTTIEVGTSSGVTFGDGFPIPPRSGYEFQFRASVALFAITNSASSDVAVLQAA